jgi:5-methyltetrahydrofolate--homocysteine methyltransferase
MAAGAGMTSAIMNPLHDPEMHAIWGADVVLGKDKDCARWIKRFREPVPEGQESSARGGRSGGRRRRSAA